MNRDGSKVYLGGTWNNLAVYDAADLKPLSTLALPGGDMGATLSSKSAWHAVGEQIASLLTFINKTYSETGQVKLTSRDWRSEPCADLIEHILKRYHARHREQLPELIRLARRVEHVHGARPSCPNGLADLLNDLQQELESHMLKEEQVLFPMLQQGYGPQAAPPIQVMRFEHDQHGESLEKLLALTNNITPPADACNTWRALYRGLLEFRDDLMQHIHLENNVLFINALNPR